MTDARAARLQKLEEKKKKLAAYRDRGKKDETSESVIEPPIQKTGDLDKLKEANSVDQILSTLETELPAAKDLEDAGTGQNSQSLPSSAKSQISRSRPPLIVNHSVAEFSIVPKVVNTYNKGISTKTLLHNDETEEKFQSQMQPEDIDSSSSLSNSTSKTSQSSESQMEETDEAKKQVPVLGEYELNRLIQSKEVTDFLSEASLITNRAAFVRKKFDILVDFAERDLQNKSLVGEREISLNAKLSDQRWTKNRAVTSLSWSQKHEGLICTSYSENQSGLGLSQDPDGVVLLWSIPSLLPNPEYIFTCQPQVLSTTIPSVGKQSGTIVVGGTYNGQILIWDCRAKSSPVQSTSISSAGHTHPVYSVQVVGTQNSNHLVSISTDGKMCAWTLDNLTQPIESLQLVHPGNNPNPTPIAPTCSSFPVGQANHFYMGSESGIAYQGIRHGSNAGVGETYFEEHFGPITSIDFHPPSTFGSTFNFSHLFLTTSFDWSIKLWSRKVKKSLASFNDSTDYVYDARWSPSHPSVFSSVDGSGRLSFWNLNEATDKPILAEKVSDRALNKVAWSLDSKHLAAGDTEGNVFVYDVGEHLVTSTAGDEKRFEESCRLLSFKSESFSAEEKD